MNFERLQQLIANETGRKVGDIAPETLLDNLVEDSLEFLDLFLKVQSEYGCDIPDSIIPGLKTVADLEKAIELPAGKC